MTDVAPRVPSDIGWASNRARGAMVVLVLLAAYRAVVGVLGVGFALAAHAHAHTELVHAAEALGRFASYAQVIAVGLWMYAASHNAKAHLRAAPQFAPALAAVSMLVPLASLVLPFLVLHDLRAASDVEQFPPRMRTVRVEGEGYRVGGEREEAVPAPRAIAPVLACGVVAGIHWLSALVGPMAVALFGFDGAYGMLANAVPMLLGAVSAVLYLLAVRAIDLAQQERAARIAALEAAATA